MASAFLKGAFCVVNFLYSALAIMLAAGAVYFSLIVKEMTDLRNYEKYQLDSVVHWPQILPYIFVAIAVFILLVMCCGCFGMGLKNKELLITYSIFIAIVVLLLLAAGVVASAVAIGKSEKFTNETIRDVMVHAARRPDVKARFGEFEQALHCCGAEGHKDYVVLPLSCCDSKDDIDCSLTTNQRRGCIEVTNHYIKWIFIIGTSTAVVTAILCVVSVVLAVFILRSMGAKCVE